MKQVSVFATLKILLFSFSNSSADNENQNTTTLHKEINSNFFKKFIHARS
jgi:hypothetical protein